jgi:small subunit ribosomal protein S18
MPRKFINKRKKEKKKIITRKKACPYCVNKELPIDYKQGYQLSKFLTERGKIVPRRVTGVCAFHQRELERAIRKARILAFLPYTVTHSLI